MHAGRTGVWGREDPRPRIFDPSIFLCFENLVHKKSACSKIKLIFFNEIFAFFSALLIHDLIALVAFSRFTIVSLYIPSDGEIILDII